MYLVLVKVKNNAIYYDKTKRASFFWRSFNLSCVWILIYGSLKTAVSFNTTCKLSSQPWPQHTSPGCTASSANEEKNLADDETNADADCNFLTIK